MSSSITEEYESYDLRRIPIPPDVESSITTPHSHESLEMGREGGIYAGQPLGRPLWLIWTRRRLGRFGAVVSEELDFPTLDSVADNEESARMHYRMAISDKTAAQVSVERIPANHRFASSLGEWQMDAHMAIWKVRAERNKREGD
jgi:hypothetical protein